MNTKRFLAFLLCALLCFTLIACSDSKDDSDDDDDSSKSSSVNKGDENCTHEFTEWETTKESSCTKDGKMERECSLCGKEEEQIIVAPGHFNSFGECEVCGKKLRDCEHKKVNEVTISEVTCVDEGRIHHICTLCKVCVEVEYIPYEGHVYVEHEGKDATCTEDGWYYYYTCEKCDYSSKETVSAYGHEYIGGVCDNCGGADPEFTTVDVEQSAGNPLKLENISENPYTATAVEFVTYEGEIAKKNQKDSYELTATYSGRYYFGLSEVYAGTSMDIYVYDRLGGTVNYSTYIGNGEGVYADLEAGEKYTVKVCHRTEFSQYILTIGQAKAAADITGYTVVNDAIEYNNQRVNYTFTAAVTGIYRFNFSNMIAETYVRLYVYNYLGETVNYGTYIHNGDGVTVTLNAGETYAIEVQYQAGTPDYSLSIGYQKVTNDISGYTAVYDTIYYKDQVNIYTYTPAVSGNVIFYLTDVQSDASVYLYIYNHLGERLTYNSYCGTGESVSYNLTAGNTYTIQVAQQDGYPQNYGLVIGNNKAPYSVSGKVAVNDRFDYDEQSATYEYTATADGELYITLRGYNGNGASITVYNENGVSVYSDSYFYDGDVATIYDVTSGEKYTVVITASYGSGDFTIAFG